MPARRGDARRRELLDAVIASVGRHGLGTRSLRDLAADAGTSHRMLVHHFGSRDGLLVAVVREVEARQAAALAELAAAGGDPLDAADALWQRLAGPELRPFERLFFECYARGAQGEAPFDQLLPGLVDSWLEHVAQVHPGSDPALVRLGLAVSRGLLLDLVATGDRAGVDAAMAHFTALLRAAGP